MKRSMRLTIALLLTAVFIVAAVGVWAAPKYQGTVPPPPTKVVSDCSKGAIDMGTALFTPQAATCKVTVELVDDPAGEYVGEPEGKEFTGDTFKVTADPADTIFQVCYAYPTEFAKKEAKIHRLNQNATPAVWVEVSGAVIGNGTICVTSAPGVFSLIGKH